MTSGDIDSGPSADEAHAALARLCAFGEIANSPRLTSFLEFIVNEELAGRGASLRAYTVATSVFQRGEDFDPHSNSIVRVEATRLRKALKNYYAGEGANDPVRIEIPLGGYIPKFYRPAPAPRIATTIAQDFAPAPPIERIAPAAPSPTFVAPPKSSEPRAWRLRYAAGGAVAALAGVLLFSVVSPQRVERPAVALTSAPASSPVAATENRASALPVVSVHPIHVGVDEIGAYAIAGALQRDLANAISRFDEVVVQRGFAAHVQSAPSQRPHYELEGQIDHRTNGHVDVTFRLLHSQDKRLVWSGGFNLLSYELDEEARVQLVRSVVSPIAQPFGAIASDLRSRIEANAPAPKSIECLVRFEEFWESRSEAKRRSAFDCITSAITAYPRTAAFHVALSNMYVAEYLGDLPRLGSKSSLAAAEEAARTAIKMAPGRAHPYLAMSQAMNLRGAYDGAVRLAERAFEMNPYDTDIMAQLGSIYVLRGKLDQGARLLHEALEHNPAYPGWIKFYLFLEAYLRGDTAAQQAALKGLGETDEPDVAFARVIAAADAENLDEARRVLTDLRAHFPNFAAAPRAALERLTLAPDVIDRMMASAKKVGL